MSDDNGILLKGLDGSNPLAFLASLGTLRTLGLALPDETVRMNWEQHDGAWRPRIWCSLAGDNDMFVTCLIQHLPTKLPSPWTVDKRLPFAASLLQELMRDAVNACPMNDRMAADLLAAFGSEVFVDDKGNFSDTSFRMVRSGDSAGQGLLYYARKNAESTTPDDLRTCLFDRWIYADRGSSFRWDPAEDKMYALQANNPSDDGSLSVVGANRLALEALVLFPVEPTSAGAATTGFVRPSRRADLEFRWPIWTIPLTISVIASLLANSALLSDAEARVRLEMGVAAVFKSRQFKPNQYYRNFSPAEAM
jgi:hypothetical protein